MKNSQIKILATIALLMPAIPALAMPGGEHMMKEHKMSKQDMKKLTACKAMDHAMAMKNKRCAKLMKDESMSMPSMGAQPKEGHAM